MHTPTYFLTRFKNSRCIVAQKIQRCTTTSMIPATRLPSLTCCSNTFSSASESIPCDDETGIRIQASCPSPQAHTHVQLNSALLLVRITRSSNTLILSFRATSINSRFDGIKEVCFPPPQEIPDALSQPTRRPTERETCCSREEFSPVTIHNCIILAVASDAAATVSGTGWAPYYILHLLIGA